MNQPVVTSPVRTDHAAAFFAEAPFGMALLSLNGSFIEANRALCRLTGRSLEQLLATPFDAILHHEDANLIPIGCTELITGRCDTYRFEGSIIASDGLTIDVLCGLSMVILGESSTPYLTIAVVESNGSGRDEQHRKETLTRQGQILRQLRQQVRNMETALPEAAHELKAPLSSMLGYLELLADGDVGELSGAQQETLDVIVQCGQRLSAMLKQMLSLDDDGTCPTWSSINISELLNDALVMMQPTADRGQVLLSAAVQRDVVTLDGDVAMLQRILVNLLSNAIKFTPAHGTIDLRCERDLTQHGDLILSVSDTGIGIPAEELPLLFTRFYRTTAALTDSIPGTGLGLSITADLVRALHGHIEIDSEVGSGTTVRVILPERREARSPAIDSAGHVELSHPARRTPTQIPRREPR